MARTVISTKHASKSREDGESDSDIENSAVEIKTSVYIDPSINSQQCLRIKHQIRKLGNFAPIDDVDRADIILANRDILIKLAKNPLYKLKLRLADHLDGVLAYRAKSQAQNEKSEEPEEGKVRIRRAERFYDKANDGNLALWIAYKLPDPTDGCRTGIRVYKELLKAAKTGDPMWSWADGYSVDQLRERYKRKDKGAGFDALIASIVSEKPQTFFENPIRMRVRRIGHDGEAGGGDWSKYDDSGGRHDRDDYHGSERRPRSTGSVVLRKRYHTMLDEEEPSPTAVQPEERVRQRQRKLSPEPDFTQLSGATRVGTNPKSPLLQQPSSSRSKRSPFIGGETPTASLSKLSRIKPSERIRGSLSQEYSDVFRSGHRSAPGVDVIAPPDSGLEFDFAHDDGHSSFPTVVSPPQRSFNYFPPLPELTPRPLPRARPVFSVGSSQRQQQPPNSTPNYTTQGVDPKWNTNVDEVTTSPWAVPTSSVPASASLYRPPVISVPNSMRGRGTSLPQRPNDNHRDRSRRMTTITTVSRLSTSIHAKNAEPADANDMMDPLIAAAIRRLARLYDFTDEGAWMRYKEANGDISETERLLKRLSAARAIVENMPDSDSGSSEAEASSDSKEYERERYSTAPGQYLPPRSSQAYRVRKSLGK